MTFSMGTTPAAARPARDRLEDGPEAAERGALDVAERREDGVLREGARLAGIGDDIGHGGGSLAARRTRRTPSGGAVGAWSS